MEGMVCDFENVYDTNKFEIDHLRGLAGPLSGFSYSFLFRPSLRLLVFWQKLLRLIRQTSSQHQSNMSFQHLFKFENNIKNMIETFVQRLVETRNIFYVRVQVWLIRDARSNDQLRYYSKQAYSQQFRIVSYVLEFGLLAMEDRMATSPWLLVFPHWNSIVVIFSSGRLRMTVANPGKVWQLQLEWRPEPPTMISRMTTAVPLPVELFSFSPYYLPYEVYLQH